MAEPTPPASTPSIFDWSRLKDRLKKYGKTGIYVYLGISFTVTAGWYVAIERNVDVKKLLGIKENLDREPAWYESMLLGKGSNIALAIVCSKLCVPLKIPVAVAVTPYVHRWRQQLFKGFALSKSG